jgi:hypothetical protein
MLLQLAAEDASAQYRLRNARMRRRVLGHLLTTLQSAAAAGRRSRDAAGRRGRADQSAQRRGIQYALHSAQ